MSPRSWRPTNSALPAGRPNLLLSLSLPDPPTSYKPFPPCPPCPPCSYYLPNTSFKEEGRDSRDSKKNHGTTYLFAVPRNRPSVHPHIPRYQYSYRCHTTTTTSVVEGLYRYGLQRIQTSHTKDRPKPNQVYQHKPDHTPPSIQTTYGRRV